ncbi:MAG: MTAP family purine nucleoside phosphorylase [Fimbriimonadales bacterium]|nr:MTAP family purine nucleoside phosphorylase [Fimbriimonadales bacterium]
MRADVAIIGGTGVGARLDLLGGSPFCLPTPFGPLRGRLVPWKGIGLAVVHRHGLGHRLPPHRIAYRAMADGLARLEVRACLATAAVGSLRAGLDSGSLAVCTDFLDLTGRNSTLFDGGVRHTDFSSPMGSRATAALREACSRLGVRTPEACVYVGMNGPRYETPAEVRMLARLGGDVVGMTAATEAILCREAGVDYGCLAIVSNLGTGLSDCPLSHREVEENVAKASGTALAVLFEAAEAICRS